MNPSTTAPSRRSRLVAVGVIASTLTVAGAGAAIAANAGKVPDSAGDAPAAVAADAPAPAPVAADAPAAAEAGDPLGGLSDAYTQEQYDALWGAGYTTQDLEALAALWGTEYVETKARVGQMVLDGEAVPVAPGSTPFDADDPSGYNPAQYDALWDAGYTFDDVEALAALWATDVAETKARAGQALLDGQTLPVAPGSTPAGS
ncbi:hypothetical protein AB6N23_05115 [Cellulomonas sp. 179-A 9B4 NHS]|uniref:hypothetical protein n=1 Tax=Cellulomonas sp. 179-A 9B4 NHS TaxID=3142379 RepID=UPI0039A2F1DA